MTGPLLVLRVCLFVLFYLSCSVFMLTIRWSSFQRAENMRGDADQVADVRNRRASILLPINPSKIITAVSGSMHRMP